MTPRDRFMGTLTFQDVPVPNVEIALWQQTMERWLAEGMPAEAGGVTMYGNPYFGLEGYDTLYLDAIQPNPPVPYRELAEDEETVTFIDTMGRTRTALKTGTVHGQRMSMDTYLRFAVYDRESFQSFKQYYLGPVLDRYPADWQEKVTALKASDKPLTLLDPLAGTFGYYSMLRNWMGTEGVSYLLYDDPGLIEACLEFLTEFAMRVLTPAIESLTFDFYYIHEDMSYKNGPLVSPAIFKKYFVPHYERFIRFLKGHGITVVLVDTDGNHDVLTPLFLDSGNVTLDFIAKFLWV
ncbi:MAG TPA: hypothetical protein PLZ36_18110, partial [Armatimonadota bacterium]|nr:hypothetical protein [Armatimonadota bacterium]